LEDRFARVIDRGISWVAVGYWLRQYFIARAQRASGRLQAAGYRPVSEFRHGKLAEGRARSAGLNPALRGTVAAPMRSGEIEPVQVHHLVPCCNEVFHKLLF
jgi:hypothetical protein